MPDGFGLTHVLKPTVRTFNSVYKPAGPPGRFHAQACDRRSAVWVSIHPGKPGV